MAEESGRTRFHHGFYAAMEICYGLANIPLTYEQEVELGKDPVRLDFLIIKKEPDIVMNDPIGEFLRQVNIFEYKSPEDGLSIDDFYKVQGYGLIYKGFGRKVNELPLENLTLTLVRHRYPRDMMKMLRDSGITVSEVHSGIYRFEGNLSIPVQLVITSQITLDEYDGYDGLKLLAKGATMEDIKIYIEKVIASGNERLKDNAGTVIEVCLDVNKKLKGAKEMYESVKEVFKDAFARERQEGRQEGRLEGRLEGREEGRQEGTEKANERVVTNMLRENFPLSLIEKISQLSEDAILGIAGKFGLAVVHY